MLKVLGINALLALLLLGAVELTMGDWFRRSPTLYMPCNDTWAFTQNLYPAEDNRVTYTKDANCMRGNYASLAEATILTVGGSTTDQRYLNQHDTWQQHLADALAAQGKPVNIANGGVDGQSTVGHLWNFENWYPQLEGLAPKIIVFYVGMNDSLTLDKDLNWQQAGGIKDVIKTRSALYRLYRTAEGLRRTRNSQIGHQRIEVSTLPTVSETTYTPTAVFEGRMEALSQRVEALAEKTRQKGAQPVFVTQRRMAYWQTPQGQWVGVSSPFPGPEGGTVNGLDLKTIDDAVIKAIIHGCQRAGATCLNLAETLPLGFDDYYDYGHSTPQGAAKIGTAMAAGLAPLLP